MKFTTVTETCPRCNGVFVVAHVVKGALKPQSNRIQCQHCDAKDHATGEKVYKRIDQYKVARAESYKLRAKKAVATKAAKANK